MAPTTIAHVRLRSGLDGAPLAHPELRPRLVADAVEEGTNLTEVALAILHKRFRLPFVARSITRTPNADEDYLRLRLPAPLYHNLTATYGTKYVQAIREILCAHYGLPMPAPPARTRVRRKPLAA